MELHEENPFKIRSYQTAVNTIDRGGIALEGMDLTRLQEIKGIGKNIAEVISAIKKTQTHPYLDELLQRTPEGLLEVLQIKGLGPRKIKSLWKDLNVTSLHELAEACQSGQVTLLKGFGERTQQGIILAMEYTAANLGKWLIGEIEELVEALRIELEQKFGFGKVAITGDYPRKPEIIELLEFIIETPHGKAEFDTINSIPVLSQDLKTSSPYKWRGELMEQKLKITFHFTSPPRFVQENLLRTGSKAHLLSPIDEGQTLGSFFRSKVLESEAQAYEAAGLSFIPPEL